jgi:hypothetical protein
MKWPEMHKFGCFSDFWAEDLEWQRVRIGVFVMKTESWMANHKWSDIPSCVGWCLGANGRAFGFSFSTALSTSLVQIWSISMTYTTGSEISFSIAKSNEINLQVNEVWAIGGEAESTDGSIRITSK